MTSSFLTIWLYLFEEEVIAVGLGGTNGGATFPFCLIGMFGGKPRAIREGEVVDPEVVPKEEFKVEDDLFAIMVPLLDSPDEEPWVLKLAFDRLRRSLRKEGMANLAC